MDYRVESDDNSEELLSSSLDQSEDFSSSVHHEEVHDSDGQNEMHTEVIVRRNSGPNYPGSGLDALLTEPWDIWVSRVLADEVSPEDNYVRNPEVNTPQTNVIGGNSKVASQPIGVKTSSKAVETKTVETKAADADPLDCCRQKLLHMDTCPSIPKLDYVSSLLTSLAPSRDYSVGGVEGVGDLTATKYDFTSFHDSLNPKLLEKEEGDYEFLETGFEDSYFLPFQGQCQCLGAESRKEKELDAFRKARLTIEAAITEWEIQPIHSHALEMVRNEARSYLSVLPFKPVKSLNSALDWKFFPDSTGKCSVKDFERAKVQTQGYLCSAFKTIRRNLTSNKDPHCKYLSTPPERGVHSILRDRSQRLVPARVTPTGLDPCGTLCGSSSYWTNHFYRFKASYLGTCEIPRGCRTNAAPCFGQTAVSDSQFSSPFDCYSQEYPEFSKNAMHTPDPCNFYPEHIYYDSQGLSTPYKKHV